MRTACPFENQSYTSKIRRGDGFSHWRPIQVSALPSIEHGSSLLSSHSACSGASANSQRPQDCVSSFCGYQEAILELGAAPTLEPAIPFPYLPSPLLLGQASQELLFSPWDELSPPQSTSTLIRWCDLAQEHLASALTLEKEPIGWQLFPRDDLVSHFHTWTG